jgi:hypothetical protein
MAAGLANCRTDCDGRSLCRGEAAKQRPLGAMEKTPRLLTPNPARVAKGNWLKNVVSAPGTNPLLFRTNSL